MHASFGNEIQNFKTYNLVYLIKKDFQVEKLEGVNAVNCRKCKAKRPQLLQVQLRNRPKLLIIQLRRYLFMNNKSIKIKNSVITPEILKLDSSIM